MEHKIREEKVVFVGDSRVRKIGKDLSLLPITRLIQVNQKHLFLTFC